LIEAKAAEISKPKEAEEPSAKGKS